MVICTNETITVFSKEALHPISAVKRAASFCFFANNRFGMRALYRLHHTEQTGSIVVK